jgi:hypothetical protein
LPIFEIDFFLILVLKGSLVSEACKHRENLFKLILREFRARIKAVPLLTPILFYLPQDQSTIRELGTSSKPLPSTVKTFQLIPGPRPRNSLY